MAYVWRICPVDSGTRIDPNPDCPNAHQHTAAPSGYLAAFEWAERMVETHDQLQCPGCDLWVIWEPGAPLAAAPDPADPYVPREVTVGDMGDRLLIGDRVEAGRG